MKAIAIIDIPDGGTGKWYIDGEIRYTEDESLLKKFDAEMIPLKPLPDCPEVPETISNDVAYILGWNDCLVEISKEQKEANSLIRNEEESVSNRGER